MIYVNYAWEIQDFTCNFVPCAWQQRTLPAFLSSLPGGGGLYLHFCPACLAAEDFTCIFPLTESQDNFGAHISFHRLFLICLLFEI